MPGVRESRARGGAASWAGLAAVAVCGQRRRAGTQFRGARGLRRMSDSPGHGHEVVGGGTMVEFPSQGVPLPYALATRHTTRRTLRLVRRHPKLTLATRRDRTPSMTRCFLTALQIRPAPTTADTKSSIVRIRRGPALPGTMCERGSGRETGRSQGRDLAELAEAKLRSQAVEMARCTSALRSSALRSSALRSARLADHLKRPRRLFRLHRHHTRHPATSR